MKHLGLSSSEARSRLDRDGPNELPVQRPPSPAKQLAAQMFHFFALLLWGASGLAFLAGMPALGVAIFVVIVVNGLFAFVQEQRAERAAEALRRMLPRRSVALRDGRPRTIDAAELVVGDIVVLSAGDRITADLRLLEATALAIDASTLTGESVATRPSIGAVAFAGTFVQEGEALGEVVATGARTRLAGIAALTRRAHHGHTPLARELARLVRIVAIIAASVGVGFFLIAWLVGLPMSEGFLFAIGVTVALVPEGLLPTVTLSLALGARRMAAHHALVRRLDAVESLGSTTFICTDKTGTLTENRMAVVRAWTPRGEARVRGQGYEPEATIDANAETRGALEALARAAARCSTGHAALRDGRWVAEGDPMEAALDVFARRLAIDLAGDAERSPTTARFPFDPRRRSMSVVVGDELLVKGALDALLPRCRDGCATAETIAGELGRAGLRVLAVARRTVSTVEQDAEVRERDLELLGLVGLEDPPRAGVLEAIASCRRAGIRVAMITGDHATTATAIGREIGLLVKGGVVVEGKHLPADDAELAKTLDRDGTIVCRASPEDKLRIARALQARGHVVAMTGDGVNDAPALRQADVGIAMGRSGTDVAREAADLVLLDDHFATIVLAVARGRAVFVNLRRALGFHLTDNVAELVPFAAWAVSGGRFPLALSVLQILCLDLLTDQIPALALGAEPVTAGAMSAPVRGRHLVDRELLVRSLLAIGPVEAACSLGAFVFVLARGGAVTAASGAAFAAIVFGQVANAFTLRAHTPARNSTLLWACVIALAAMFVSFRPRSSRIYFATRCRRSRASRSLPSQDRLCGSPIGSDVARRWSTNRAPGSRRRRLSLLSDSVGCSEVHRRRRLHRAERDLRRRPGALGQSLPPEIVAMCASMRAVKHFANDRSSIVTEAIDATIILSNGALTRLDGYPSIKVVLRADWDRSRVAVISGGGSGHEPAHVGFVGDGLLTAAVCGEIFASPSVDAVLAAILAVTGDAGCLLIVKNYTGDRLNFGLAAEKARALGRRVEMVIVGDDIALPDSAHPRGIAGTLFVHKIAGHLARVGASLEVVRDGASRVASAVRSIGLSLNTCTIPGQPPELRLAANEVELGLGIHGEPGAEKIEYQPMRALATVLAERLNASLGDTQRVAVLLNDLGGVPPIEMAVATSSILEALDRDVSLVFGPARLMTSLDMKGLSVSALPLDDLIEQALLSPVAAPAWAPGVRPMEVTPQKLPEELRVRPHVPSTNPGRRRVLEAICNELIAREAELNALDAKVGDGDTGSTFASAARAILADLDRLPLAEPPALCAAISERLSSVMGGSSGILLSIGVAAMGVAAPDWPRALRDGVRRIQQYGGAAEGDRTMLDALLPAIAALEAGRSIADAAAAASTGAERTASMTRARAGRSGYVPSEALRGVPDPGAVAIARVFDAIARAG